MSLRAFHIFFIIVSDMLAVGFGVWALPAHVGWAVASFLLSALIGVYLVWFIRKSKGITHS